jgi:DNA-binding NarL/FixJ family response regulator
MHDALRTLLKSQPNMEIVGSAGGGLSAFELLMEKEVQLVVIDAGLPLEEVLALLRLVKATEPSTRRLVLTVNGKDDKELLSAGADIILPRNSSARRFAEAVTPLNS